MKLKIALALAILVVLVMMVPAFAGTLNVNWAAPTTCSDGTALSSCATTGYKIYTGPCGQAKTTVLASPAANATSASVPNIAPGKVCIDMTTLASGGESAHSAEASATIPAPLPSPPGGVTATATPISPTAYSVIKSQDSLVMLPVGRTNAQSCDVSQAVMLNGQVYNAVPASSVTFTGTARPIVTFAICG